MKRVRVSVIMALLVVAPAAMAVPAYNLSWDFNSDALGGGAAGWTSAIPSWATTNPVNSTHKIFNASQYAPSSGMPIFDSNKLGVALNSGYTGSMHTLAQPTNSFIFQTEVFTDINDVAPGNTNWLAMSGVKMLTSWNGIANAGETWYEPDTSTGKSKNLRVGGSNLLPAQDGFTGGNRRLLVNDGVNGLDNVLANSANAYNEPATVELKIKYNTPDNPGTIEYWARTQNYTSWRNAFIGVDGWFKMGWKGTSGAWHDSVSLAVDPFTGTYAELTALELHSSGWTHSYFDDVSLTSIPEPATIGLLLLGLPMLRRRRA